MKQIIKHRYIVALLGLIILAGSTELMAQKRKPVLKRGTVVQKRAVSQYTVDRGTVIRARMNKTISSKTARVGDTFSTTVTEPVYSSNGVVVIPNGSVITGKVSSVKAGNKGGKVGEIDVDFIAVRLPNGTNRTISGSLTDLSAKNANSDNEGTASGDKIKHRKVIFIGGGAAGGAILGAAIGGGKGALIGGIIGAGGGFLGDRLLKGADAEVKSGTEFGIYLNQSVSLPKFSETPLPGEEYPTTETGSGQTYVVQPGDTLSKISVRFYGTSSRYMDIYNANRSSLSSPANISVGQELIIP